MTTKKIRRIRWQQHTLNRDWEHMLSRYAGKNAPGTIAKVIIGFADLSLSVWEWTPLLALRWRTEKWLTV